jgi:PAS domain S-box-containing protein
MVYLPIGIGLLILASLVGYGYYTGERLHAVESPFLQIIHETKLESAAIRFRVEEALDGEERLNHELAWGRLEQMIVRIERTYESVKLSPLGISTGVPEDLRPAIGRLSSALAAWKELSIRLDSPLKSLQSTDLRDGMAGAFRDFSMALSDIETQAGIQLELKKTRFRTVQATLIGTFILLAIGAAAAARHNARERSGSIARLTAMNRQLQEEISRREIVEGALAERSRLFGKVFNESPVSILIARLADMRIVDVNEWFLTATGFEREEILARPLNDVVICSDPTERKEFQQLISEQKQLRNLECQLPVKDGSIRTALLSATLVDLKGEAHILSAARDITEFRAAELTLCQSEQKFRSLVESAPDFILLMDLQGVILLANPAACRRLGYSADEITGHPLTDFLSPESRRSFTEQLPAFRKKGELRAEYDMVGRTGAVIPVDCSATTVESENDGAYIVLFQKDITERRHNELKFKSIYGFLIAANQRRELQSMLEDFVAAVEVATACDAAAVRIEDESLAKPFIAIRGFDVGACQLGQCKDSRMCTYVLKNAAGADDDGYSPKGSFYCNSAGDLSQKFNAGGYPCPAHPASGPPLYESYALTPILGPAGRVGLIHIAYRDKNKISKEIIGLVEAASLQLNTVIQRVWAEGALQRSHNELERRVRERTEELSIINERLKAEVLERTLTEKSLMHHQQLLRKLSSVLVQTEERERRRIATAIHDGVGQTLAAAKIKLGTVQSSIPQDIWEGQLADVRGLITLAIEESRSLTFELSPPVLYEIGLQSALEWMAERFQRQFGLPISVAGDGSDRQLCIPHRVLAFQSVRELCFNSVKHARASRVAVFSYKDDEDFMRIEVSDDGTGFDVKKRCETDTDMGFGLFSIREQLRHHGGALTLDSRPGKGTRVTLRLPMDDPADGKGDLTRHD